MVTVMERNSLSTSHGLCVVEERDTCMLSEARADAAPKTSPAVPGEAKWQQVDRAQSAVAVPLLGDSFQQPSDSL